LQDVVALVFEVLDGGAGLIQFRIEVPQQRLHGLDGRQRDAHVAGPERRDGPAEGGLALGDDADEAGDFGVQFAVRIEFDPGQHLSELHEAVACAVHGRLRAASQNRVDHGCPEDTGRTGPDVPGVGASDGLGQTVQSFGCVLGGLNRFVEFLADGPCAVEVVEDGVEGLGRLILTIEDALLVLVKEGAKLGVGIAEVGELLLEGCHRLFVGVDLLPGLFAFGHERRAFFAEAVELALRAAEDAVPEVLERKGPEGVDLGIDVFEGAFELGELVPFLVEGLAGLGQGVR